MDLKKCLLPQISPPLDASAPGCHREPVTAMELESHLLQPYLRLPLALEISPTAGPPALPQLDGNPAGLLLGTETPKFFIISHHMAVLVQVQASCCAARYPASSGCYMSLSWKPKVKEDICPSPWAQLASRKSPSPASTPDTQVPSVWWRFRHLNSVFLVAEVRAR